MKAWLQRFMYGRYGQDDLSRFLTVLALIFGAIALWMKWQLLNSLAVVLLFFCLFRVFSRNAEKRRRENLSFLRLKNKIVRSLNQRKLRFSQRKTHRFYTCPSCRQQLRVPRGKGSIVVRCPKCRTSFGEKT
ncbi:MAG: hypothetical protein RBT41_04415 [Clostridia bacterium]|nr:hypothetical protein [Clostridia bacterium]